MGGPLGRGRAVKMLLATSPSLGIPESASGRSTISTPRDLGASLGGLPEPGSAPPGLVGALQGPADVVVQKAWLPAYWGSAHLTAKNLGSIILPWVMGAHRLPSPDLAG